MADDKKPIKVDGSDTATAKIQSGAELLLTRWEAKNISVKDIAGKYADLEHDLNYVVQLNKWVSEKYETIIKVLPNVPELNIILESANLPDDRARQIKLLKSAVVALEAQGVNKHIERYIYKEEKKDEN